MDYEIINITKLGDSNINSPLKGKRWVKFVTRGDSIISNVSLKELSGGLEKGREKFFESAGPREKIYFNPQNLRCGIVSCGGLCPGINDIIRELVVGLWQAYGVKEVDGFRYGYRGLAKPHEIKPMALNPEIVDSIHRAGGSILSSSRGPQDVDRMVDVLEKRKINILFAIGGDGTMRGAHEIALRIRERGLKISVMAVPKTIDNDINYVNKSFGFETAVQASADIIDSAHTESKGAPNCIGLVKLMGRSSGFIAAYAALANRNVNYCLIPEVPFRLEGRGGLLAVLEKRLEKKHHAVIVVAEGAGQYLMENKDSGAEKDKSGNVKLKDIGHFLENEITNHFTREGVEINIKYFNPSYIIRSIPANALDSEYCVNLAQNTVHAAMSGRTDMLVSSWNSRYVHVPIPMAVEKRKAVNPAARLWRTVMGATHQPVSIFR
ncbi:MAG: ATP-dependent 6-phosphofructokinase [Elusimicrobiota bacterium]